MNMPGVSAAGTVRVNANRQPPSTNHSKLPGFLEQCHVDFLREHHLLGDQKLANFLVRGEIVHQVEHQILKDHPKTPRAHFAVHGECRNGFERVVVKLQSNIFELEQLLILADDGVLGLAEDLDQRFFAEILEHPTTGRRPTNSGMNPNRIRSNG